NLSNEKLKKYEGIFINPFYSIKIEAVDNKLKAEVIGLPVFPVFLIPSSETKFYEEGMYGPYAEFKIAGDSINEIEMWNTIGTQKFYREGHQPNNIIIELSEAALKKFVGVYEFNKSSRMQVYIRNKNLKALLPGQPEYTLLPIDSTEFIIENLPNYKMIFGRDAENKIISVTSSQPNGDFKAEKISDAVSIDEEKEKIKLSVDELKKFEGTYEFAPGNEMKIYLKDDELKALLSGQPEYTLQPVAQNEFNLKGMQGFKIVFEEKNGQIISVTSMQPNGSFKANKK
ncbi:MAG: hypothetical protein ABI550_08310, partial [Ignavibacteriaceae bacterium]